MVQSAKLLKPSLMNLVLVAVLLVIFPTDSFAQTLPYLTGQAYQLFTDRCSTGPKSAPTPSSPTGLQCDFNTNPVKSLVLGTTQLSNDTYLAALADERVKNDTCASDFINEELKPAAFNKFVENIRPKIEALANELRDHFKKRDELMALMAQKKNRDNDAIEKIRAGLESSAARISILQNTIPLSDRKRINDVVMSYVDKATNLGSLSSAADLPSIDPAVLREQLKTALTNTKKDIDSDIGVLKNGVDSYGVNLDRATRESLAQDQDLVEGFTRRNPDLASYAKGVICDVNAEYGRGAKLRDQTEAIGSIALTLGSMGTGWIARGGVAAWIAASAPARLAAATGVMSLRVSKILSIASLATATSFSYNRAAQACWEDQASVEISVKKGAVNRCEDFTEKDLQKQDCAANAALLALGGLGLTSAILPNVNKIADRFRSVKSIADATATVPLIVRGGINSVPSAVQAPLPEAFINSLKSSPTAQSLAKTFEDGKGLTIDINYFSAAAERTGDVQAVGLSGERIQAAFVAKTIREILPKAKVIGGDLTGSNSTIKLRIGDGAEWGKDINLGFNRQMEMANIKGANPGGRAFDKTEIRKAIGFLPDSKIVSLNLSLGWDGRSAAAFVREIEKSHPNVIIVSKAVHDMKEVSEGLASELPEYTVVSLSKANLQVFDPAKKYIVINDTAGHMNAVYSAADLNVTVGPVNLAEPLSANRPSVFFDHTSKHSKYYSAFKPLEDQAVATGGGFAVSNNEQMAAEVKRLFDPQTPKPVIIAPYTIPTRDGAESPIEKYLSNIKRSLEFGALNSGSSTNFKNSAAIRESISSQMADSFRKANSLIHSTDPDVQNDAIIAIRTQEIPSGLFERNTAATEALKIKIEESRNILASRIHDPDEKNSAAAMLALDSLNQTLRSANYFSKEQVSAILDSYRKVADDSAITELNRLTARELVKSWSREN